MFFLDISNHSNYSIGFKAPLTPRNSFQQYKSPCLTDTKKKELLWHLFHWFLFNEFQRSQNWPPSCSWPKNRVNGIGRLMTSSQEPIPLNLVKKNSCTKTKEMYLEDNYLEVNKPSKKIGWFLLRFVDGPAWHLPFPRNFKSFAFVD